MDLPALGKEDVAKDLEENDKKWKILLCRVGEREKSWKNFWKNVLNESNTDFKKLDSRYLIDRKTSSINRTKQRLTEIFKRNFDWLKNSLDRSKL